MIEFEVFIKLENCTGEISLGTFNNVVKASKVLNKAKNNYENFVEGFIERKVSK